MSQHEIGVATRPTLCVSRHGPWCLERPGRLCMSRPGMCAQCTTARSDSAHMHAGQGSCTRDGEHDGAQCGATGVVHAHCAHDPSVVVHCVVHYLGHWLGHCSWTLFLSHCSFKKKNDPQDLRRHKYSLNSSTHYTFH